MKTISVLKKTLIFSHELEKTSVLYTLCLGLKIKYHSQSCLELADQKDHRIVFYKVDGFSTQLKGYSPVIMFKVEDFDDTLSKLKQYGAEQDNEIVSNEKMKIAFLKAINNEMISIYSGQEVDSDDDKDDSTQPKGEMMTEIQQLLKKLNI